MLKADSVPGKWKIYRARARVKYDVMFFERPIILNSLPYLVSGPSLIEGAREKKS